jgi:hypothetical protein
MQIRKGRLVGHASQCGAGALMQSIPVIDLSGTALL